MADRMGDALSDDSKRALYLLNPGLAESAWRVARETGVDRTYAEQALARMADALPGTDEAEYQVIRRFDLGPDVYEALEDSAREGG